MCRHQCSCVPMHVVFCHSQPLRQGGSINLRLVFMARLTYVPGILLSPSLPSLVLGLEVWPCLDFILKCILKFFENSLQFITIHSSSTLHPPPAHLHSPPNVSSLLAFFFLNNTSSLLCAVHRLLGMEPSAGAWSVYQETHPTKTDPHRSHQLLWSP